MTSTEAIRSAILAISRCVGQLCTMHPCEDMPLRWQKMGDALRAMEDAIDAETAAHVADPNSSNSSNSSNYPDGRQWVMDGLRAQLELARQRLTAANKTIARVSAEAAHSQEFSLRIDRERLQSNQEWANRCDKLRRIFDATLAQIRVIVPDKPRDAEPVEFGEIRMILREARK